MDAAAPKKIDTGATRTAHPDMKMKRDMRRAQERMRRLQEQEQELIEQDATSAAFRDEELRHRGASRSIKSKGGRFNENGYSNQPLGASDNSGNRLVHGGELGDNQAVDSQSGNRLVHGGELGDNQAVDSQRGTIGDQSSAATENENVAQAPLIKTFDTQKGVKMGKGRESEKEKGDRLWEEERKARQRILEVPGTEKPDKDSDKYIGDQRKRAEGDGIRRFGGEAGMSEATGRAAPGPRYMDAKKSADEREAGRLMNQQKEKEREKKRKKGGLKIFTSPQGIKSLIRRSSRKGTAIALKAAWAKVFVLPFIFALAYINFHFFMAYFVRSPKFVKFGKEWLVMNLMPNDKNQSQVKGGSVASAVDSATSLFGLVEILALFVLDVLFFLVIMILALAIAEVVEGFSGIAKIFGFLT